MVDSHEKELDRDSAELFAVPAPTQEEPQVTKVQGFTIVPTDIPPDVSQTLLQEPADAVAFNVLDIETTGFSPLKDKIVEVWIGKFQSVSLIGHAHFLINPGVKIPKAVSNYHGITDKTVSDKRSFGQVAGRIIEFLGADPVVCHNAGFDLAFLRSELIESGYPVPQSLVIDTLRLARRQFGFAGNDLGSIANVIGVEVTQPSGSKARDDTLVTAAMLGWMTDRFVEKLGKFTLKDLVCLQAEFLRFNQFKPRM